MSKIIPAGYRIVVTSWENDADNYNTGIIEGLTRPEAKFVAEFVMLFSSQNDHRNRGIGNMYEPTDAELAKAEAKVKAVVERHKATIQASEVLQYFLNEGEFNDCGWHEFAYDLNLAGGEFYTRVMDDFTVEFYPEPLEVQDVTAEFQ